MVRFLIPDEKAYYEAKQRLEYFADRPEEIDERLRQLAKEVSLERAGELAAAACLLGDRIGTVYEGVVTGAGPKGTWVRIFDPPVEGRVGQGREGLDVGDRVRVKLVHTDPERGFIDFVRAEAGAGARS